MYEKLGYVVYRRVKEYYQDDGKPEDGLGIKRSLFLFILMFNLDPSSLFTCILLLLIVSYE